MNFFQVKDKSLLIIDIIDNKEALKAVIGVPHHTPGGTLHMRCKEHFYGDENTGYIGNFIANKLNCSAIYACNYFLDPNKYETSDYYLALLNSRSDYLIEIHGHDKSNTIYDIEISCGSKEKELLAVRFKEELQKLFRLYARNNPKWNCLRELKIGADFEKIFFKATKTLSIQDPRWKSLHIELTRELRVNEFNGVPEIGYKVGEAIAEVAKIICK